MIFGVRTQLFLVVAVLSTIVGCTWFYQFCGIKWSRLKPRQIFNVFRKCFAYRKMSNITLNNNKQHIRGVWKRRHNFCRSHTKPRAGTICGIKFFRKFISSRQKHSMLPIMLLFKATFFSGARFPLASLVLIISRSVKLNTAGVRSFEHLSRWLLLPCYAPCPRSLALQRPDFCWASAINRKKKKYSRNKFNKLDPIIGNKIWVGNARLTEIQITHIKILFFNLVNQFIFGVASMLSLVIIARSFAQRRNTAVNE